MDRGHTVKDRLLLLFREEFEDPGLDERVSTASCPAWDSLVHIKLLMAIEQEFGFEPTPDDIAAMYSDFHTIERLISLRTLDPLCDRPGTRLSRNS